MKIARPLTLILFLALAAGASTTTYTVRVGDTLSGIAGRFHVPLQAVVATNQIKNPDLVMSGSTLAIPDPRSAQVAVAVPIAAVAGPATTTHLVEAGETLTSIAHRYATTVDALRKLNGLTNDLIREGRTLKVPATAAADPPPAGQRPLCPVQGAGKWDVADSFGAPRPGHKSHEGDDIFAKRGTPVLATVDGTVRFANGHIAGNAYYLAGDNGTTYYGAHLDRFVISPGRVKQGQLIGFVGNTGDADVTPPHLHFEIHPGGGKAVDPYSQLRDMCR